MKAVIQRVLSAELYTGGKLISQIGKGLCVYLGVGKGDSTQAADKCAAKIAGLRIFEDTLGKMNLSLKDIGGEILLISQFTLYGDVKKGFRPSFSQAEEPEKAAELYNYMAEKLMQEGIAVKLGVFGADMRILQQNDGPVTIIYQI